VILPLEKVRYVFINGKAIYPFSERSVLSFPGLLMSSFSDLVFQLSQVFRVPVGTRDVSLCSQNFLPDAFPLLNTFEKMIAFYLFPPYPSEFATFLLGLGKNSFFHLPGLRGSFKIPSLRFRRVPFLAPIDGRS